MVNTRLQHRMVTPSYNTGKLQHRMVTPSYNTGKLQHRMVTPSYNTGKLQHRMVTPSYNTRIVNKRLKHRNGCHIEKVNNKTHTFMHTINRKYPFSIYVYDWVFVCMCVCVGVHACVGVQTTNFSVDHNPLHCLCCYRLLTIWNCAELFEVSSSKTFLFWVRRAISGHLRQNANMYMETLVYIKHLKIECQHVHVNTGVH